MVIEVSKKEGEEFPEPTPQLLNGICHLLPENERMVQLLKMTVKTYAMTQVYDQYSICKF